MSDTSPMIDVTVKVPQSRVPAFYAMVGEWLQDPHASPQLAVNGSSDRLAWDPASDLDLAVSAWRSFPDRAKAVFGTLIDNPGRSFSGAELAELHGIPNGAHGVAGVLAHPGRQVKKLNRGLHFKAEKDASGSSGYLMDTDIAALFGHARTKVAGK